MTDAYFSGPPHPPQPPPPRRSSLFLRSCLLAFAMLGVGLFLFILLVFGLSAWTASWFPEVTSGFTESGSNLETITLEKGGSDKILVIPVSGLIMEQGTSFGRGGMVSYIKQCVKKLKKDRRVRAILLDVNSPGGGVTAADTIYHTLQKARKETGLPIVAFFGDIAASGGYYISMAADKIVAQPTTVTGSIGVIMFVFNAEGLCEKIGVKDESIKSGKLKEMGSPFHTMTPEERDVLQGIVMTLYDRFVQIVARGRKLPIEKVKQLADGRIFDAKRAMEDKLIDRIGYREDAIAEAEKLAGISHATLIEYLKKKSFIETLLESRSPRLPMGLDGVTRYFQSVPAGQPLYVWPPAARAYQTN